MAPVSSTPSPCSPPNPAATFLRIYSTGNIYLTIDEIQRDLDEFMGYYNLDRTHQGYRLGGRTPAQALREALGIDALPNLRFDNQAAIDNPRVRHFSRAKRINWALVAIKTRSWRAARKLL